MNDIVPIKTTDAPPQQRELPSGWRWVRLGEMSEINPRRSDITRRDMEPTSFVPMEVVDAEMGVISEIRERPFADVKKGYTYFEDGDVLFAKITPCMQNGKHAIARNLIEGIGFASTEFHVIRPAKGILADWIHPFIRQPAVLQDATNHFTGAVGQQRVPDDFLKSLEIPLPPLFEQRRISGILREQMAAVEKARTAAQARLEAVNALPAAFLRQVFPQPGQPLPDGWRWVKLGDVIEVVSGQVDPKEPRYRDLPHVNGENIESGTGRLLTIRSAAEDRMTSGKYFFEAGVVLYSKLRPYLKKAAIADFRGLCSADMYPILPKHDELTLSFLLQILLSEPFTTYAESESQRARMPKLNRDQLFAYAAPLPPLPKQKQIAAILREQMSVVENTRAAAQEELNTINALRAALLRRAFNGEL
jgi:restriction endonuclease S subunit